MIEHKPLNEISGGDLGWLKAKHHFAIGRFGNPIHKPVGNLYVWNDDEIAPHTGFGMHSHADVEIITYVRAGVVSHKDSLGNEGHIKAGDIQVISAGTGIQHSESNDGEEPTKIFQLWLRPKASGGKPDWGTSSFPKADRSGRFIPLASGRGTKDTLTIRSNAELLGAVLPAGDSTSYDFNSGDSGYLVVSVGAVEVNGRRVSTGEGIVLREEPSLEVEALEDAELVFVVTGPE